MTEPFSIGYLARSTGVKPTTIRWYEQEGWLPPPARTGGGRRAYGQAHMRRLGFIRHARELGFDSEALRALLDLADRPEADCAQAHAIATAQIKEIDARLRRLAARNCSPTPPHAGVISHPTLANASTGSLAANTHRTVSNTDARFAFAVLTTERKAA